MKEEYIARLCLRNDPDISKIVRTITTPEELDSITTNIMFFCCSPDNTFDKSLFRSAYSHLVRNCTIDIKNV